MLIRSVSNSAGLDLCDVCKGKWSREWLGKRKAAKLDTFLGNNQEGKVSIQVFDLLDYLAETLPLVGGARHLW
jgi:hypothetical protein